VTFTQLSIETSIATMTLVEPDYVVQRFREGSKLDRPGFEENRRVRQELKPANPYVMLSILPEDLDFELNIIATDHFGAAQEVEGLAALAVVAHGQMAQGVTAIFFKYFPPKFPARIFSNEEEARDWLNEVRSNR
jgi:hypothetical protein